MAHFNLHTIANQSAEMQKLGHAEAARMLDEYRAMSVIFAEAQGQWKELARVLGVDGDNIDQMFSRAHTLSSIEEDFDREMQEVATAIGSVKYMDPPDGGSPSLADQVGSMRKRIDDLEDALSLTAACALRAL
jgi:hypothetical protein